MKQNLPYWKNRMSEEDLRKWRNNSGISTLFFDGASIGNPRLTGAGGVIFDHKGTKQQEYAWGIGRETNNVLVFQH